mmetsp:Transcript_1271/g.2675  ORF Transcript_1271/g.2675 Transcript_1271/m.2675 type:complete len:284 (+) Transcript_1271:322-1173(+)
MEQGMCRDARIPRLGLEQPPRHAALCQRLRVALVRARVAVRHALLGSKQAAVAKVAAEAPAHLALGTADSSPGRLHPFFRLDMWRRRLHVELVDGRRHDGFSLLGIAFCAQQLRFLSAEQAETVDALRAALRHQRQDSAQPWSHDGDLEVRGGRVRRARDLALACREDRLGLLALTTPAALLCDRKPIDKAGRVLPDGDCAADHPALHANPHLSLAQGLHAAAALAAPSLGCLDDDCLIRRPLGHGCLELWHSCRLLGLLLEFEDIIDFGIARIALVTLNAHG